MEQNFKKISKSSRNSMMIVLLFGSFVALLAETFLNNAIPTIMNSLNVSQTTAQWLTTAYLLVVGLMIPISAWIFESFQLKSNYLTMMSIFLIGSLICLTAPNFECLLLGRLIEAIAAGSLMPFTQNVILLLFPKEQRGMAMGITGLVIGFGPAIGPTISGLILKYFSWRMLFLTLSIASLLVMVAAISVVKNITIPKSRATDFVSFVESIIGFGLTLYTLSEVGNTGKVTPILLVLFGLGIVILALFVHRQLNLVQPLLDIRVFKNWQFDLCSLLSTCSNIAMVAVELLLPLYLQTIRAESALTSGLVLMPGAIIMMICNPIAGSLYDKLGVKKISLFGFTMLILGTLPMLFFNAQTNLLNISICYAIRMIGISFTMMNTFTAGINLVKPNLTAHANAAASTLRQIGGSFGTAIAMLIVSLTANSSTNKTVALANGFHAAFILLTCLAFVGMACSLFLPQNKRYY